jgi:hypothetical protein
LADRPDACATLARVLHEPLPGTAPLATGWLVVEDPGPWGRDPLADGTLPDPVRAAVADRLAGLDVRYQAIRRLDRTVGPGHTADPARTVLLAHGGPTPWARRLSVPIDDLSQLDPAVTLSPQPPDLGVDEPGPVVLVCTHGRRDACCAERGRPVAATLTTRFTEGVWETTHTGGHRFAPNVILLPWGVVYGFLDADVAVGAVAAITAGRLDLDHYRGRSATPRAAQAAEVALRRAEGLDVLTDVTIDTVAGDDRDAVVGLTTRAGRWTARVAHRSLPVRPVSCGADPSDPGTWEVVTLERA